MRAPTRLRTRARASAVPRTTARAASTTPPRASRLRWRAARAGEGGAYIGQVGDARGVPRADVRVERRRRVERLRAEPPAVHAGGKALACVGADACAPNRTRTRARARTQHTGACVRRARIGDPFICVDIYIHTCRVRWLYIPADAPTRARDGDGRIVGARKSHARVHARRCSRMRAHTHLSLK
jgi:hypothetical protein